MKTLHVLLLLLWSFVTFSQSTNNKRNRFLDVATYLFDENDIPKALKLNNELFLKATKANDSLDLFRAHNCYGWIYDYLKNEEKVLHHYQIALNIAQAIEKRTRETFVYNNIGAFYRDKAVYYNEGKLKNLETALSYFFKAHQKGLAYKLKKTNGAYYFPIYNLGLTNNYLAEEYENLNQTELAEAAYEKTNAYFSELLSYSDSISLAPIELSNVYYSLGNYHTFKNQNEIALEFYKSSIDIAEKMESPEILLLDIYYKLTKFYRNNQVDNAMAARYSDSIYKYSWEYGKRTNKSANEASKIVVDFEQTKFDLEKLKLEQEVERKEAKRAKTLNFLVIFICLALFIFAVAFYRKSKESNTLRIKAENALKQKVRLEQKINKIEDSIASDLHDNFGNKLNNVVTAYQTLKKVNLNRDRNDQKFNQVSSLLETNLKSLSTDIEDLLWANNSKNNKLYNIIIRIKSYLVQLERDNPKVKTQLISNYNSNSKNIVLPKLANRQILMIVKEATHNAIKYSKTDTIEVAITVSDDDFLEIKCIDHGIGFDRKELSRINGLNNMEMRSKTIDFDFKIDSIRNKGTSITIRSNSPLQEQFLEQVAS